MASAVDKQPAAARPLAVAAAGCLPTATRGSQSSYTTLWDTTPVAHPSLSLRASVRLPLPRFQSPLTEPGVPISGTGLSSGIMRLAHGPPGQGRDRAGEPADRGRCTTAILPPASSPMRRRACSRLDDIEPIEFDSFASACDALRTLGHQGGVLGRATPAGLRPSRIPPHLSRDGPGRSRTTLGDNNLLPAPRLRERSVVSRRWSIEN